MLVFAALAMGPPGCFGPGLEPPGDLTPVGAADGAGARQQAPDAVVDQPPAVVGGAGAMDPFAGQNANGEADAPAPDLITDGGMPDAALDGGDDDEDAGSSSQ